MLSILNTTIEQILGEPEERYFGDGFRFFSIDLKNLELFPKLIEGQAIIKYNGPPRPHGEAPHVGSIEFMTFSLRISSYAINRLCRINIADTNRAFLKKYSVQITNSMSIGTHNFTCRVLSTLPDISSLQGYTSQLEIQFENHVKIKVTIDHRGYSSHRSLPENELISFELEQLHSLGYKSTKIDFSPLEINLEAKTISSDIYYKHLLEENTFHGLSSARNNLLPTDAIRIYGQLMQSLLYKLGNSDRNNCHNIWLRKMHMIQERPLFKANIKASLIFEEIREIKLEDDIWKLINLNGSVGSYTGSFQVAHKVN